MEPGTQPGGISKTALWAGRILSVLPVLLLLFSSSLKLIKPASVVEGFAHFGFPPGIILGLGILELACTVLYVIPRTSVLGAILLTGYLGGATVTHLRVGEAAFILPPILGVVLWGGLYLRDGRLRPLLPLRK